MLQPIMKISSLLLIDMYSVCTYIYIVLVCSLCFFIFRSFNLEFPSIYCKIKNPVKLQNRRNCCETIVSIGLGGNDDIMRPEPTLLYVMQYNLDILIIVVVTRKIKQLLRLKCINTWLGFFILWIRGQIGDYVLCLHMLILGIYMFFNL